MSSTLCCPICCEEMQKDDLHLLRHFKYKRFPCSEPQCDLKFYTAEERMKHCGKTNHKKSFEQNSNPYLDLICRAVEKDAVLLNKLPMEQIVVVRSSMFEEGNETLNSLIDGDDENEKNTKKRKKRIGSSTENAEQDVSSSKKKSRADVPIVETPSVRKTNSSTSRKSTDSSVSTTTEKTRSRIDSAKKAANSTRTPRTQSIAQSSSPKTSPIFDDSSTSLIDPIRQFVAGGFYDPNDPNRVDTTTVACSICNIDVGYDYLVRKDHVGRKHIAADVAPEEYKHMMKTNLDIAFPDFPNTDLACQLCPGLHDVPTSNRREHIEKRHPIVPEIVCPIISCHIAYKRQCDLSTHLRETHRTKMQKIKDKEWQEKKRRRNCLIQEMTLKCFPITQFDGLKKIANQIVQNNQNQERVEKVLQRQRELSQSAVDNSVLNNDVRVQDLNRTRRPQIYNQNDSTSSSSSDDDNELTEMSRNRTSSEQLSTTSGENQDAFAELSEDDVICIKEIVNKEYTDMQKKRLINIKLEKEEPADNQNAEQVQLAPLYSNEKRVEEVVKEEEEQVTSSSVPVNGAPRHHSPFRSSRERSTGASSSRDFPRSTTADYPRSTTSDYPRSTTSDFLRKRGLLPTPDRDQWRPQTPSNKRHHHSDNRNRDIRHQSNGRNRRSHNNSENRKRDRSYTRSEPGKSSNNKRYPQYKRFD